MGINLRSVQRFVAQDFFLRPYVHMPMLIQQCRGCMPELVRCDILRKSSGFNSVLDNDLDSLYSEPNTPIADKKRVIFGIIVVALN